MKLYKPIKFFMKTTALFKFILFSIGLWLSWSCGKDDFPEYKPKPVLQTKTLNLFFIDKSNPTTPIALYLDDVLLRSDNPDLNSQTRGLQQFQIPDSLRNRTFTVSVAEYQSTEPPDRLPVDGILFDAFLLPTELDTLSTVVLSRDNPASPITLSRYGIATNEPAPANGFFKIKFINLTSAAVGIFRRDKSPLAGFDALALAENRPYAALPFGLYRFIAGRNNLPSDAIQEVPNLLRGEAGKVYTALVTDGGIIYTEAADFGKPNQNFGYMGFVNLLPKQESVTLQPFAGATRKDAQAYNYTAFKGVELLPAGNVKVTVTVAGTQVTGEYLLQGYESVMAFLVEKEGKPALQFVPIPTTETNEPLAYVRFINFSPDAGKVSFVQIAGDAPKGSTENFVQSLDLRYASNLAFGELRFTQLTQTANSTFTVFGVNGTAFPLQIQAHKATEDPFVLGEPIAGTRIDFPFFVNRPSVPIKNYSGATGEAGIYTVILTGDATGTVPEGQRLETLVIGHSF
jgi:hypothetical protein